MNIYLVICLIITTTILDGILCKPRPQLVEMAPYYSVPQYRIAPNVKPTAGFGDQGYSGMPSVPGSINNNIINALPGFPISPRIRAVSSYGFQSPPPPPAPPQQYYGYQRPEYYPQSQYSVGNIPQYPYRPPPSPYFGVYAVNENRAPPMPTGH